MQSGEAQFSAANNYDNLLNHDVPEILANRFTLGDFQDGPNLLLTARVSEATNYPEYGANWYWDGVWKSPWPWAIYLAKTGDVAFVSKYFHDDSAGASSWGPSLYTMMHEIPGQLTARGLSRYVERQRLDGPVALRRLLRVHRTGRVQVHRHGHRQHDRSHVGRWPADLVDERDEHGARGEPAGKRLLVSAVRSRRAH